MRSPGMNCHLIWSETLFSFLCRPIPVPEFISRQIVLDWVEIVEKEDSECAHLGKMSQVSRVNVNISIFQSWSPSHTS